MELKDTSECLLNQKEFLYFKEARQAASTFGKLLPSS